MVSQWTGIPLEQMEKNERLILHLEKIAPTRDVGQKRPYQR